MIIRLLFLLMLLPTGLPAQFSTAVQKLAPGGMAFFSSWQTGILNNNNGIQSTFGGYDEVHALLVPQEGMSSLPPGAHSFYVELTMDDRKPVLTQVDLPPLGPQHSAIAIPIFPGADNNVLPELAGMMALLLNSSTNKALQHQFRVRVFAPEGKRLLAEGGFETTASFVVARFHDPEVLEKTRELPPPPDEATAAYLSSVLTKDYAHLRLLRAFCWRGWAESAEQPSVQTCVVVFQVQDSQGRCYAGRSTLRRKVKKNGNFGPISGVLWPNLQEDCGD